jgi:hypothetical protein
MYLIKTLGRAHISLSMVKQEARFGMSVKVFVPKDNSAKEIRDLVSLALPQRWGQRKENVACRTAVASKSYLAKKGKITANNQAAISFGGPDHSRPFAHVQRPWGIVETTH